MGLLREDGSPKPAAECFPPGMGICQWFHFEDHRLDVVGRVAAPLGRSSFAYGRELGRLVSARIRNSGLTGR